MAEFTGNQDFIEVALAELEASMPAIIARREIPKYVGGTIATGTLANLGRNGPPFFYVNKYATYEKKTFLQWLRTHKLKLAKNILRRIVMKIESVFGN